MEKFIVRIFRRDPADPKKIGGSVECGRGGERKGFLSSDALVNILALPGGKPEESIKSQPKSGTGDAFESMSEVMESIRAEMEGPEF